MITAAERGRCFSHNWGGSPVSGFATLSRRSVYPQRDEVGGGREVKSSRSFSETQTSKHYIPRQRRAKTRQPYSAWELVHAGHVTMLENRSPVEEGMGNLRTSTAAEVSDLPRRRARVCLRRLFLLRCGGFEWSHHASVESGACVRVCM